MSELEKIKIVISDCHLSAGRFYEGRLNAHEDFNFDQEMCAFIDYFSSGIYGDSLLGPVDVELFINGDYLDFLNVPYHGNNKSVRYAFDDNGEALKIEDFFKLYDKYSLDEKDLFNLKVSESNDSDDLLSKSLGKLLSKTDNSGNSCVSDDFDNSDDSELLRVVASYNIDIGLLLDVLIFNIIDSSL